VPDSQALELTHSNLLEALGALGAPRSFSALLHIPLSQPDKILGGADRPSWVHLVLAACAATGGEVAYGAHVAAAVEVFMAALDVLDEIEDGDSSPTVAAAGIPQALNVATALLLLGQRMLLELPPRPGLPSPGDFARVLTTGGVTATTGQHLDLANEGFSAGSSDEVLEIARRKAGALAGAACRLGAMVGTADQELLDLYGSWGTHYGTVAQLANDLHDAVDETDKSDVTRQKSTLPLIFNQGSANETGNTPGVVASGALHFTWVVVEIERQACRDLADELDARGQDTTQFRQLVP
jgi:geranylgeranyl pyrophosphate synthase